MSRPSPIESVLLPFLEPCEIAGARGEGSGEIVVLAYHSIRPMIEEEGCHLDILWHRDGDARRNDVAEGVGVDPHPQLTLGCEANALVNTCPGQGTAANSKPKGNRSCRRLGTRADTESNSRRPTCRLFG